MTKKLTLGILQTMSPYGFIGAAWRNPDNASVDYLDLDYWTDMAKELDEAGFDFLFFADSFGYPSIDGEVVDAALRNAVNIPMADPFPVIAAIAAVTNNLGVVVTGSTLFEPPPALARRFSTLDHFTKGRVGWNVVTGVGYAASSRLFGQEQIPHNDRYAHASEHLNVTYGLWEGSWEEDALLVDREAGIYADPKKVHQVSYSGKHFKSDGILNVPPSPQRTPLVMQAGTSNEGRDFAAQNAEVVFLGGGSSQQTKDAIDDINRRAESFGRKPGAIKFMLGATFIVAETDEAAQAAEEEMLSYATREYAAAVYAFITGIDLLKYDQDKPIPVQQTNLGRSSLDRYKKAPAADQKTVGEILEEWRSNGHNAKKFVGTPVAVADQVEQVIAETGADGFLIQPYIVPGTHQDFARLLMPILKERGMVPESPDGPTLRERVFGHGNPRLDETHPAAQYRKLG
ncbi:NtaA/DmoA family FMN-dependent monooxygenase [Rhodococcus sp. NPDC057529]|uniref:NtaA/DmoA family FMN-dependent monooxygenase n=1 Tax=Rhodococcus sp. NPDC057529 TaxID=3346158 RepID=UPI00366C50E6